MELKELIKVYDDVWNLEVVGNFIRYLNDCKKEFTQTEIVGKGDGPSLGKDQRIDRNIRRAEQLVLSRESPSLSNVHWHNLLFSTFQKGILKYEKDSGYVDHAIQCMTHIGVLKYEQTGFYNLHIDHCLAHPRILSFIYLLNNDYQGGELTFYFPKENKQRPIDIRPNRLIIWPSAFMFPHGVKPVTKGVRYTAIGWAS